MALFKKKSAATQIPELQEYYATQKKDNTALAWLLAFLSLIVTAVIIVGLFVGGRIVYRKITHKNDKDTVITTNTSDATPKTKDNADTSAPNLSIPQPTVTVPETSNSTSDAIANPPKTNPAPGVSTAQSPGTNSSAVAAATTVPNTGAGNTIGLFMAVTILAYAAHYQLASRKN